MTHTETTVTITRTETQTSISRTTTGTTTMTTTTTATTATQTYTESTVTHTHTDTTMTSTATETMTEVMTTAVGAATKITVTMAVKVEENAEEYIEDSGVKQAYTDLMQEITGLDAKMIDVDMTPAAEESEITVTYLLTIPWEDQGNGMEEVISSDSVMSKLRLAEQDLAGLNEKLDQKMEAVGVTDFSQEVQKVDDDHTTAINGALRFSLGPVVTSLVLYLFSGPQLPF